MGARDGRQRCGGGDGGRGGDARPPRPPEESAENLALAVSWLWLCTVCLPLSAALPGVWSLVGPTPPVLLGGWAFATAARRPARWLGAGALILGVAGYGVTMLSLIEHLRR